MLVVEILINGKPIERYTALNIGVADIEPKSQWRKYKTQDGSIIEHRRDDGAKVLAIKLLRDTAPKLPGGEDV